MPILVWKNLMRNKGRTGLTLFAVLISFVLFGVLMTTKHSLSGKVVAAQSDQLITFNKIAPNAPLPLAYARRIEQVPGLEAVSYGYVFLGAYQKQENAFVVIAVPPKRYVAAHHEFLFTDGGVQRWIKDRTGAMVTQKIAKRFGWKVGQHFAILSQVPQRSGSTTWYITVDAIFKPKKGVITNADQVLIHYKYLDEARIVGQGQISFINEIPVHSNQAAQVSRAIDNLFVNAAPQTRTSSIQALAKQLFAQAGNIGAILVAVITTVFFSMLLIISAIILYSVRQRIPEYGVMYAVGFQYRNIACLIIGEAVLMVLVGGLMGIGLASAVVMWIGSSVSQYLPTFALTPATVLDSIALMIAFGLLAALLPVFQLRRLSIPDALGRF